jgi:hypothetical protein
MWTMVPMLLLWPGMLPLCCSMVAFMAWSPHKHHETICHPFLTKPHSAKQALSLSVTGCTTSCALSCTRRQVSGWTACKVEFNCTSGNVGGLVLTALTSKLCTNDVGPEEWNNNNNNNNNRNQIALLVTQDRTALDRPLILWTAVASPTCCSLSEYRGPVSIALCVSIALIAAKAQQEPHCPWSLGGTCQGAPMPARQTAC